MAVFKKMASILLAIIGIVALVFVLFLGYVTITDDEPEAVVPLPIHNNKNDVLKIGAPFSMTTFNIGYAGLDKGEDFFMDGGSHSHASSKQQVLANMKGIMDILKKENSTFTILQEVDVNSSRSFHVNELDMLKKELPYYSVTFAQNYHVPWVPVPVLDPMGSTDSGIATFSKHKINKSTRYALPGKEYWPRQLFELDRCLMENRYPLENGKELIVTNLHLSVYDKGGKIRKQQIQFLKEYVARESQNGNYLILVGDWNHLIPGTDPKKFATKEAWPDWMQLIPQDFVPKGFKWVYDASIPTSRTVTRPYEKGVNFTSHIDGFLVSPNIEVQNVHGHNLGFVHSDHNPVTAQFVLR